MKTLLLILCLGHITILSYAQTPYISFDSKPVNHDWEPLIQKIDSTEGHIKLYKNKWLMCFLHWRPLTRKNSRITPKYVRNKLLTFWGPNMDFFTLKDYEGEMEINGHRAYYVNGDFRGIVETRFIVWNCPETQRQFIADININKRMATPNVYLELQQLIAKTTSCHKAIEEQGGWILPKKYANDSLNISFFTPSHWKTGIFETKTWFPEGPSDKSASLWTLSTTSEKQIDIMWYPSENDTRKESIKAFFNRSNDHKGLKYKNIVIDTVYSKNNYKIYQGQYILEKSGIYKNKLSDFSNKYKFIAKIWSEANITYFLVASIITIDTFWGRDVSLNPDELDLINVLNEGHMILNQNVKPLFNKTSYE